MEVATSIILEFSIYFLLLYSYQFTFYYYIHIKLLIIIGCFIFYIVTRTICKK